MDDIYLSVDGRETRLDDNPSQELRRQFGELQKRVRALNNYTRFAMNNINANQYTSIIRSTGRPVGFY